MAILESLVFATGTLTSTGAFTNAQTVVIGGKTYTSQTSLTDVDGHFLIGADQTASHLNLLRAINLGAGAGTLYATATTENPHVEATSSTGTTTVVKAKVPGAIGNHIPTTETQTNASWGGATLASGSGDIGKFIEQLISLNQVNAEVLFELKRLTPVAD